MATFPKLRLGSPHASIVITIAMGASIVCLKSKNGVVFQSFLFEEIHHDTHVVIDVDDHSQVVGQAGLKRWIHVIKLRLSEDLKDLRFIFVACGHGRCRLPGVEGLFESLAEGERLTTLMGCLWCHGEGLGGQKYFANADKGFIIVAPDLTAKIRDYSEAEFARAVRHGVRPDGTSLQIAMPAYSFYDLSDADLKAIMAYIMQLPEQNGYEGGLTLKPIGWYRWLAGKPGHEP